MSPRSVGTDKQADAQRLFGGLPLWSDWKLKYTRMKQSVQITSTSAKADGNGISVLLVEDDQLLRESLADYLSQNGMSVTEAASGAAFRSGVASNSHDVIVLDINLPDISGFELTELAKRRSDAGIIILSARTARDDRVRGYSKGADIYLVKPVDVEELGLAISNLARRRRSLTVHTGSSDTSNASRELTLDRRRQVVITPSGVHLKVSAREAAFLEYIAAHSSDVVSRSHLAQIFGEDQLLPSSRVTDVALARLRARLRKAGVELPLQVVRNVGYRLLGKIRVT